MISSSNIENSCSGMVSIVIPAYNAENWIKRSVESVLHQTYKNVEVVVVENGSTDKTTEMIETIQDTRLRLFHSAKGVSNARNLGIECANGEFITFLDADDWLAEDAIERLMVLSEPDVDLISARYYDDKPFETYKSKKYEVGSEEYIQKCLYTPTRRGNVTGNLYRTEFIKSNNIRFDPDLSHAEDSVFFLSLLLKNPVVLDCEEPIYHVYINPESVTRKGNSDNVDEFRKAILKVYELLNGRSKALENSGYIFALNQLLVILVHGIKNDSLFSNIREIRRISEVDVFDKALKCSDISQVNKLHKIVMYALKKHLYLVVYMAIQIRARNNQKENQ